MDWRLALLWTSMACAFARAGAIEDKCGACRVVAGELQARMDEEGPRNSVDLRHRLDSNGNRYGKVIEYRFSELRMVELLEDLCGRMNLYTWGYANINEGGTLRQGWALKEQAQAISFGMSDAEGAVKQKELLSYCGRLIEEHEDELVEAIRTESFDEDTGLKDLLCVKLAGACETRSKEAPPAPDEL
eukprot:evm.model.scf_188.10 EVM.evm.TU.scf_188.10   scf_188:97175-98997(+)